MPVPPCDAIRTCHSCIYFTYLNSIQFNRGVTMSETNTKAREVVTSMLGDKFLQGIESAATAEAFGAPLAQLALDFAFGGVWARPGLDRRSRSLGTMGMLIALGLSHEFKNHVRIAIANGITVKEIEELITHSAAYVGLPLAGIAMSAATEALRDMGKLSGSARTSHERGLT